MNDLHSQGGLHPDEELSILDILQFLEENWKFLFLSVLASGSVGVGVSFVLPEKYIASASIQSAKVLGNDIESISVLAEKMKSPTYYSEQTLRSCDVHQNSNAAQTLAKELNPNVAKNSAFVSVAFKSVSIDTSQRCLNAVLDDVKMNQNEMAQRQIELAKSRLVKEREKLAISEAFLASVSKQTMSFDFKDTQFSASSLLLATIQSKQSEISDLKNSIQSTEIALLEPQTKAASFATPIFSPNSRVEPKRVLISLISALAGGFLGLLWIFGKRAVAFSKPQI